MTASAKATPMTGQLPLSADAGSAPITKSALVTWQKKYRHDLNLFIRDMWMVEPDIWQAEVADWLAKDETRRIAVASGHGVGKTCLDAWAAIWFVLTRRPCKVMLTAPSASTLEDGLMAEIKMWIGRLPLAVREWFNDPTIDRVTLKGAEELAFISAVTARAEKPDALQGRHADYVLLIVDEPSGVPDAIFESAQGSMSGFARYMLLTGNPVYSQGYFYEATTTLRDSVWRVRNVSCLEAKRSPPEYVEEMKTLYGEGSNTYRVRVLGLPPLADDDTIIPLFLLEEAVGRGVEQVDVPEVWGLDVGGMNRDQSALAKRKGNKLTEKPIRFAGLNQMQMVGTVAAMYHAIPERRKPVGICVDAIGMGAPVAERLRELGVPVFAINVSEVKPLNNEHYNLKSELWWKVRGWLEAKDCEIPHDKELFKALSCVRIERHKTTNKLLVEPKEKLHKRLGKRLPRLDAADAFILTFAHSAAIALHGRQRSNPRKALRRGLVGVV